MELEEVKDFIKLIKAPKAQPANNQFIDVTKNLKLIVIGNKGVGKSELIKEFIGSSFSKFKTIAIAGQNVKVQVQEVNPGPNYSVDRQFQYTDADCFMICVAANDIYSFKDIGEWV